MRTKHTTMIINVQTQKKIVTFCLLSIILSFFSCNKQELYKIEGTVLDLTGKPVNKASIEIFKTPNDWLTGHNVVATMKSDLNGEFSSSPIFEGGDYYIFVEKYDTTNWNIRDVEKGVYPIIHLPLESPTIQPVEASNMGLLANTAWKISNTMEEYTKSGSSSSEWKSTWSNQNNCIRDNTLFFGKDLKMIIDEGDIVCRNTPETIEGSFLPPVIFTEISCETLLHTSQKVKPFEFYGWEELTSKNGTMYVSCNSSSGQLYITYNINQSKKALVVYTRIN